MKMAVPSKLLGDHLGYTRFRALPIHSHAAMYIVRRDAKARRGFWNVRHAYICDRKIDMVRPLIFSSQGRCRQSWSVTSCAWLLSSSKILAYDVTNCRSSTLRFASSFNDIERLSRLAEPKEAQQSSTSRYLQWNRAGWYS